MKQLCKCLLMLIAFLPALAAAQLNFTLSTSGFCPGYAGQAAVTAPVPGADTYSWTIASPVTSSTAATFTVNPLVASSPSSISINYYSCGVFTLSCAAYQNGSLQSQFSATVNVDCLMPLISASAYTTCLMSNMPQMTKAVTLIASGADAYNWSPPPPLPFSSADATIGVRPLSSTCYTLSAAIIGLCSGTAVACVSITPQFTVSLAKTPNHTTLCRYDSLTVSVVNIGTPAAGPSSAFTYSWSFSPNPFLTGSVMSPTVVFYPLISTTYSLEVTDAQGCISMPAGNIIYVATTPCLAGIHEASANGTVITLYPNPSGQLLFVKASVALTAGVQLRLYDVSGRCVWQQPWAEGAQETTVPLQGLAAGVYHLGLYAGERLLQVQKFIKTD